MSSRDLRRAASTLITIIIFAIAVYVYFQDRQAPAATPTGAPPSVTPDVLVVGAPPSVTRPVTAAVPPTVTVPANAKFDFYVLALSWAPEFCAENNNEDPQECSIGKKLGFVLHGLWPQYNRGYPESCSTQRLPADVKAKFPGLYPTSSLYDHEWEKHGTCSGLAPEQYLAVAQRIKESVVIPAAYRAPEQAVRVTMAQFKRDLESANPGIADSMLAPTCSGSNHYLSELQVCFAPDGKPVACSAEVQNDSSRSCSNSNIILRSVR